jgi:hypothetical protein
MVVRADGLQTDGSSWRRIYTLQELC